MNGTLPNWLERWLGVEPAASGEGTVWSLENTWTWAPLPDNGASLLKLWTAYVYWPGSSR